jgi:hypothetical protein
MATIIRATTIDTDPADAWTALRDFGALHERLAVGFVVDCTLEAPDLRTITFANGAVAEERLVGIDETSRRLAYCVVASGLGASHHHASAQVVDDPAGTRFVWITDVLPDELAPTVGGLMDAGIAAIAATLGRRGQERRSANAGST